MGININSIHLGDCIEVMLKIDSNSIDLILCDLPYGTTQCKWDTVVPFLELWKQYDRILKKDGTVVLFGSQPFTSVAVASNLKNFKYELIWEKEAASNFMHLKNQFGKSHENIMVFYGKKHKYNPIMEKTLHPVKSSSGRKEIAVYGKFKSIARLGVRYERFPKSVIKIKRDPGGLHPTQKPIRLLEYLIESFSNKGDVVLDNCCGSGGVGVAAYNCYRNYILIEKEEVYFNISKKRIECAVLDGRNGVFNFGDK